MKKVAKQRWSPLSLGRSGPPLSHLFFGDDLVLFDSTFVAQTNLIKVVLVDFCLSSGHKVSSQKFKIFFSSNVNSSSRDWICDTLGFNETDDLGKYLGVSILHSKVRNDTYLYIEDNVRKKLFGWAAKSLSLSGRIILAKSVLLAIPSYAMQTTMLPNGLCNPIEKLIRNIIWGSSNEERKVNLVK